MEKTIVIDHMNPERREFWITNDYRLRGTGAGPLEGDEVRMSDGRIGVIVKIHTEGHPLYGKKSYLVLPACMVRREAFMAAGGACRYDEYLILPK